MKYKMQYGIEEDVIIEGDDYNQVFKKAEAELNRRKWKSDYQGMELDKTMLIKIDD